MYGKYRVYYLTPIGYQKWPHSLSHMQSIDIIFPDSGFDATVLWLIHQSIVL